MSGPLGPDGRALIVAVDHPLYSWPCPGLEDRAAVLRAVSAAGADAIISSYGTLRDLRESFGASAPILKLDVTTVAVGGHYPVSEYALAYRVEDALRLEAAAVLTFVQLGTSFELEALRTAAAVAARADEAGLPYVCEIMPVESEAYPDPASPVAIAAAARAATELGARVVKTTMPNPPEAMADVSGCGVPVVLAGGDLESDGTALLDRVRRALAAGAAGVAHGRNVWSRPDPGAAVAALRDVVHPVRGPPAVAKRVALVTGASRGIGRASAVALARAGHRVVAVARDQRLLEELATESGIEPLPGSLDTPEACHSVIDEAHARVGAVQVLVNNAGRGGFHDRPIWDQDRAGWRASMAVNLDAPFELTRGLVGDMIGAGWGRIVMISSTAGVLGAPSMSPYCASKHGLIGLMRSVAQDVAPHAITCNAILPGWVRTEMAERDADQEAERRGLTPEEVWAERAAENPAGRIVTPEEVAGVVAFLCSEAAAGVNGETVTVSLGSHW